MLISHKSLGLCIIYFGFNRRYFYFTFTSVSASVFLMFLGLKSSEIWIWILKVALKFILSKWSIWQQSLAFSRVLRLSIWHQSVASMVQWLVQFLMDFIVEMTNFRIFLLNLGNCHHINYRNGPILSCNFWHEIEVTAAVCAA